MSPPSFQIIGTEAESEQDNVWDLLSEFEKAITAEVLARSVNSEWKQKEAALFASRKKLYIAIRQLEQLD